jgi:hypothetical protein
MCGSFSACPNQGCDQVRLDLCREDKSDRALAMARLIHTQIHHTERMIMVNLKRDVCEDEDPLC